MFKEGGKDGFSKMGKARFLENADKLYMINYVCMNEICYILALNQLPNIASTVNLIFDNFKYVFEQLADAFARSVEQVVEISNSTHQKIIYRDAPLPIIAAKVQEEVNLEPLMDQILTMAQRSEIEAMDFSVFEQKKQEEEQKRKKLQTEVNNIRYAVESGQKMDFGTIHDINVIMEYNRETFEAMIEESQQQQKMIRTYITEMDHLTGVKSIATEEIERIVFDLKKKIQEVGIHQLLPSSVRQQNPEKEFGLIKQELLLAVDAMQKKLAVKVFEYWKQVKPKQQSLCSQSNMTTQDIDTLIFEKQLLEAKSTNKTIVQKFQRLQQEAATASKTVAALQLKVQSLEIGLAEKLEEIEEMKSNVSQMRSEKIRMEGELRNAKNQLEYAQSTFKKKDSSNEDLKKAAEKTEVERRRLYESMKNMLSRIGKLADATKDERTFTEDFFEQMTYFVADTLRKEMLSNNRALQVISRQHLAVQTELVPERVLIKEKEVIVYRDKPEQVQSMTQGLTPIVNKGKKDSEKPKGKTTLKTTNDFAKTTNSAKISNFLKKKAENSTAPPKPISNKRIVIEEEREENPNQTSVDRLLKGVNSREQFFLDYPQFQHIFDRLTQINNDLILFDIESLLEMYIKFSKPYSLVVELAETRIHLVPAIYEVDNKAKEPLAESFNPNSAPLRTQVSESSHSQLGKYVKSNELNLETMSLVQLQGGKLTRTKTISVASKMIQTALMQQKTILLERNKSIGEQMEDLVLSGEERVLIENLREKGYFAQLYSRTEKGTNLTVLYTGGQGKANREHKAAQTDHRTSKMSELTAQGEATAHSWDLNAAKGKSIDDQTGRKTFVSHRSTESVDQGKLIILETERRRDLQQNSRFHRTVSGPFKASHSIDGQASKTGIPSNMNILVGSNAESDAVLESLFNCIHHPHQLSKDIASLRHIKLVEHKNAFLSFKQKAKRFAEEHKRCGVMCTHLQRFYDKCGIFSVNKQMANRDSMALPKLEVGVDHINISDLQPKVRIFQKRSTRVPFF